MLNETEPYFDRDLLIRIGKRVRPKINQFILEQGYQAPSWETASQRLDDIFGYTRTSGHFFRADPIDWTKFSEPQVTGGLVHFLTESGIGEGILQLRFKAVLTAFGIPSPTRFTHMRADAELPVNGKRIDIYLEWKNEEGVFGNAVIEAKFGHKLTPGQLSEYRKYAIRMSKHHGGSDVDIHLIVLAPIRRSSSLAPLKRNSDWRFTSWSTWLMQLGHSLNEAAISPEFARYLRTVWLRATQ